MRRASTGANLLKYEQSPYLLQHASNPIHWMPWGDAAFKMAKEMNKPIFLSVGYSSCHWCHVMERESFEDHETAELMNELFVNIKVDREERPDVDQIYMTFVQATTGSGGWPMSVFLTPELHPFFGGTYFPKDKRYGVVDFKSLLKQIGEAWKEDADGMRTRGSKIMSALQDASKEQAVSDIAEVSAHFVGKELFSHFEGRFDLQHGGFGDAPKFPRPVELEFLLQHARNPSVSQQEQTQARYMVSHTLLHILRGGIYDQIGGGLHRYSVDELWHVPHFEKMLYDNAQILSVIAGIHEIEPNPFWRTAAVEITAYLRRDLRHPEGAFYSAEDADSVKSAVDPTPAEGAFYTWSKMEIQTVLDTDDAAVFCDYFGIENTGNAIHSQRSDPHGEFHGLNIPIVFDDNQIRKTLANFPGWTEERLQHSLTKSRGRLFDVRTSRPRPFLDDKVITAWNGLTISGLVRCHLAFQAAESLPFSFLDMAQEAARTVLKYAANGDTQTLLRSFRGDTGKVDGFADDYAAFIGGLLDLYLATGNLEWLQEALGFQKTMDRLFWDSDSQSYLSASEKDSSILIRMKAEYDGAEPSANSLALGNLQLLGDILDDESFQQKRNALVASFSSLLKKAPFAVPLFSANLCSCDQPARMVYVVGENAEPLTLLMRQKISSSGGKHRKDVLIPLDTTALQFIGESNAAVRAMSIEEQPRVVVCSGFTCSGPFAEGDPALESLLQ